MEKGETLRLHFNTHHGIVILPFRPEEAESESLSRAFGYSVAGDDSRQITYFGESGRVFSREDVARQGLDYWANGFYGPPNIRNSLLSDMEKAGAQHVVSSGGRGAYFLNPGDKVENAKGEIIHVEPAKPAPPSASAPGPSAPPARGCG